MLSYIRPPARRVAQSPTMIRQYQRPPPTNRRYGYRRRFSINRQLSTIPYVIPSVSDPRPVLGPGQRHIKATVGLNGSITVSTLAAPSYVAVTYAQLNAAFNALSIMENLKVRWISVYLLNADSSSGITLRVEVSKCYLQDVIDNSNKTMYDDNGVGGAPPRICVKIPPTQQISRKGTDTTECIYFAAMLPTISSGLTCNYTIRAGITGRV